MVRTYNNASMSLICDCMSACLARVDFDMVVCLGSSNLFLFSTQLRYGNLLHVVCVFSMVKTVTIKLFSLCEHIKKLKNKAFYIYHYTLLLQSLMKKP